MNPTVDNLTKLAEELTDRVAALETENAALKQQSKQASVVKPAAVVSEAVAKATCEALVKAGALDSEQVEQTFQVFMRDPNAAHRTICGILDAQAQTKSASDQKPVDLNGGQLVDGCTQHKTAEESCLDSMQRILGMNY